MRVNKLKKKLTKKIKKNYHKNSCCVENLQRLKKKVNSKKLLFRN